MKKVIVLLLLVVFVAGLVFVADEACAAWRKNKDDEEKAEVVENTALTAPAESKATLIYRFKNDEELGEFEQLYVSKQATFGRMGVLQAYFSMEQNNLMEIDRQMEGKFKFKMDPAKMYDLNRESKEIRELGPIPVAPPAE